MSDKNRVFTEGTDSDARVYIVVGIKLELIKFTRHALAHTQTTCLYCSQVQRELTERNKINVNSDSIMPMSTAEPTKYNNLAMARTY